MKTKIKENNSFDLIIVGGGAAGILAAISAALEGISIALLEKGDRLGRKILITGGGRCNITNSGDLDHYLKNIPGNGRFLYSAFHFFFNTQLLELLESLGVKTKEEEHGKIYPVSDSALTVTTALENHLHQQKVNIFLNTEVNSLIVEDDKCIGVELVDGKKLFALATILATGGLSYPQTGSSGQGHLMAQKIGHSITDLFPAAAPLICSDEFIKEKKLQGLSIPQGIITLYNTEGKPIAQEIGDIVVTHLGLSGPGVLRISRSVALFQKKNNTGPLTAKLDYFPQKTIDQLEKDLKILLEENRRKSIKNILGNYLPERLASVCLEQIKLNQETQGSQVSKDYLKRIAHFIKGIPFTITSTAPLSQATVTGGGVKVKEIDPKTMESKLIKELYLAGELVDVDAYTGGYNLQSAFSMGYLAGKSASQKIKNKKKER